MGGDTARARQSPPRDGSSPYQRNEVQTGKTVVYRSVSPCRLGVVDDAANVGLLGHRGSLTVVDPTFAQANPEILDEIGELESGADPFGQVVASP